MREGDSDLAERLAGLRGRLTYPPGVIAGVYQLPSLDPVLDEVESLLAPGGEDWLPSDVIGELEALAELLLQDMLGGSPEALARRIRVVDLLRRAAGGLLPALVADPEDDFGATLRAMLETDTELQAELGRLYPVASRAASVSPTARWLRDARDRLGDAPERERCAAAIRRVLAALLRADVQSRPDILLGGLRPANQRFARGLLWLLAATETPAVELLEAVGIRMGTSGRSDAVVRDAALANTSAALLGESADPAAATALASMRMEVTNRIVRKQVDRALEARAARAGMTVEDLVDSSLPTFGLDPAGRLEIEAGAATARIELGSDGRIDVLWDAEGRLTTAPPASVEAQMPGVVADIRARIDRLANAVAEERRRLEQRLASERAWSLDRWRTRFGEHPVARIHARTQIWIVGSGRAARAALPVVDGWVTVTEAPLAVAGSDVVRLWHPADATSAEIGAWRATLASRNVTQAIRQADREVFVPLTSGSSPVADTRHAGRIVEQPRLRALLRQLGWAVPALGAWDQGDEATAWRDYDSGHRAELRYQAPDQTTTGERVERARIVAVRFVRTGSGQVPGDPVEVAVELVRVPRRVFSEALRDVSLAMTI